MRARLAPSVTDPVRAGFWTTEVQRRCPHPQTDRFGDAPAHQQMELIDERANFCRNRACLSGLLSDSQRALPLHV